MAGGDDDIERLLKEVEAALGPTAPTGGAKAPQPVERATGSGRAPEADDRGAMARVRDGVPVALAAGAVSGAVVYVAFAIVPFVLSSFDGAVGAFLGAAGVSLAGRLRRRR